LTDLISKALADTENIEDPSPPPDLKTSNCQYEWATPQRRDETETIARPKPSVNLSPIASTNFPETSPEPNRARAKLEMMSPTWVAVA
jgi:hypothetical protein